MATITWVGAAVAVAQVVTVQVTAYDAGTTYKLTVGGSNGAPSVVIAILAAGSANATATALAAAWNLSTHPYLSGITASASTDTVTLTADTAGVPFTVTSSVSGATGTIGSATTATANSGPNDWSTAANWSGGAIPVNSDTVYFRNNQIPVYWGLAQSGVTPTLLVIEDSYTGTIGLPLGEFSISGGSYNASYPEYRASYLAIGAAAVRIGERFNVTGSGGTAVAGGGGGSALIKIDLGSTNAALTVFRTGTAADGLPAVRLKMNNASATAAIYGGQVAFSWESPSDTGQLATIDVYPAGGAGGSGGGLFGGSGGGGGGGGGGSALVLVGPVTLATHNQRGGSGVLKAIPTTLLIEAPAAVTLANASGGTITTLTKRGNLIHAGGTYTVTNLKG